VALELLLVPELPEARQAGVVAAVVDGHGHGGGGRPGAAAAAVGRRGPVPRHGARRVGLARLAP